MAEPTRQSALAGHLRAGHHGASDGIGVWLAEAHPGAIVLVQGAGHDPELQALVETVSLGKRPAAGRAWRGRVGRALGVGPGAWLVVGDEAGLFERLDDALTGTAGTAIDLGHARAVLSLGGPSAVEVLAKGCPLDLDRAPAGFTAASVLGPFNVVLERREAGRWDVYAFTSLARALADWIVTAGEEFGLEIRADLGSGAPGR